jgi:NADH:ubiquinone reductase (H+-translocating)
MDGSTAKKRIVILGGGFAGVEAARYLDRTAAKLRGVEVTLVSRDNFTVFTPMLHEVAAGDLEPSHICNPLRKLLRRVVVLTGNVESIDVSKKRVTISYATGQIRHDLPFDYLVLALGSDTNYAIVPGVAEHAFGIKTLGDAVVLRAATLALLESASIEPNPKQRKRMLTFVVAGGGFAGVETIGAINDLARESLAHYGRIDPGEVRVVLIHGGPFILPELGETLGRYAQKKLAERGVETKLNAKVTAYADSAIECNDGERIPADAVVWAAGVSPSSILKTTSFELLKGRVVVDPNMEVPGHPGIWAAGDCAAITDPATKLPYPPTAQHALREGRLIGKNIWSQLRGKQAKPFVYKAPGQLASIGRRTGVARLFGLNVSGWIGWVLWRTIYLMKLPRFEKKLRVGMEWLLNVVFERDIGQYVALRDVQSLNRLIDSAAKTRSPAAYNPTSEKGTAK